MLSLNAVKGFEYGSGFEGTKLKGSEHNDGFNTDGTTNYSFVGWSQTNSYTDTAVVAGATYYYVVVAFDEASNFSADSNRESVRGQ